MQTYLLTWNPDRLHWWKELGAAFEKRGRFWRGNWSTGRSKSIQSGSRLFLSKVGRQPRGIVASGYATSDVYEARHWDKTKHEMGREGLYIDVRLDVLLNPAYQQILGKAIMDRGVLRKMNWSPQASGVRIPEEIANSLEREWFRFTGSSARPLPVAAVQAIEGLRTETTIYSRGRSRHLRDLALKNSDGLCEACGVNFAKLLGGRGVRVLQVHHRKQLSADEAPRLTSLRDLAVLCANCHSLVHMDPGESIPVEVLKKELRRRAV